ncbi:MAG: DUF423 domain-containing protein [Alphaproteobacteria bacterium]|nr:DUF423 domain-containing protein [Alphaproteobacteria bacterium]
MTGADETACLSPIALGALAFAGLAGLAAVALGAYAAHGAAAELREGLAAAASYGLMHAVAMIGVALVHDRAASSLVARWLLLFSLLAFGLGIVLFSGGLFLSAMGWNPGTAPHGGILLMVGWAALALGAATLLVAGRSP